jgi:hypothetical protein
MVGQDNNHLIVLAESSNELRDIAATPIESEHPNSNQSMCRSYLSASRISSSFSIRCGLDVARTRFSATLT